MMIQLALALPALMALFDSDWSEWDRRLSYARSFSSSPTEISNEPLLSKADCAAIETKIASRYAKNPFLLKIKGGKLSEPICTPRSEHALVSRSLLSRETLASYYYSREIILSEDDKMIEWKELWVSRKDPSQQLHFHAVIDSEDNVYSHYWNNDFTDPRNKIKGPFHKTSYTSVTGLTPEPWSLTEHVDAIDPRLSRKLIRISKPTRQDWLSVFAPLSFFKIGSVYEYPDSLERLPKDHVSLRIYELGGVRQCAVGAESISGKLGFIPEDFALYSKCIVQ